MSNIEYVDYDPDLKPNILLSGPQYEAFTDWNTRLIAFVAGYGSGKTEALIMKAIFFLERYPGINYGIYAPTHDLISMIDRPRIEEFLVTWGYSYKSNKMEKWVQPTGLGKIYFRSMDKPESIVGYEHGGCAVDEFDILSKKKALEAFRKILARNRKKLPNKARNQICIYTTPEGFKATYFLFVEKKEDDLKKAKERVLKTEKGSDSHLRAVKKLNYLNDNYMRLIKASTYSNIDNLPEDYIEILESQYPPDLLKAYLMGEFVNLNSGQVYQTFLRKSDDGNNNATNITMNKNEPLHIGLDFNVRKMAAVIHVIRDGLPYAVDEIVNAYDTPDIIRIIKDRYKDRSILIYPDASGNNTKSVNASESDIKLLKDADFTVVVNYSNPRVRDRITCMNGMFLNGKGERRYKINIEKCPVYTKCLEQQIYDDNGQPDKKQDLDHTPDAGGYFIVKMFPIVTCGASSIDFDL